MFRLYVQAARTPGAILPLVASFVGGGLPIGMLTLAVLLLVRLQSGSFLAAGIMAAALSTGNAVGVAVQGALIDRRGQTVVLVPASLICLSSLLALVLVTGHGGPPALTACLATAGGAAIPATPSSIRALWASLLADPPLRMAAYALSAVSFTAATVLGPVLVSGLLLLGGPRLAVLVAAGLAGGGGLLFAVTPASRGWTPTVPPRRLRGWPGRGMRTLIAGNLAIGLAAGLSGIAVPAAAIALGAASLAGVFGAAAAAGDLCGGLIYGSRRWRASLATRLVTAQCGSAVTGAVLAVASSSILAMMLVLPVSGAAGAAQGISTTALLDDIAEPGVAHRVVRPAGELRTSRQRGRLRRRRHPRQRSWHPGHAPHRSSRRDGRGGLVCHQDQRAAVRPGPPARGRATIVGSWPCHPRSSTSTHWPPRTTKGGCHWLV